MSNTKKLKREHPYTDVSKSHKCRQVVNKDGDLCGKFIKTRLTIQKDYPPTLCYNHWRKREQNK